uniref:Uncharacterized protein n=1 Tax=Amphimedon queenslandica TaxID=400682 RepID=A0A1X7SVR0_AMPQE
MSFEEDNIVAGVETNGSELDDIPDEDKSTLYESEDKFEEHEWFDDSFNDEDSNDERLDDDSSDNDEQLLVAEIKQNQDNCIVSLEKDLAESEYEISLLLLDNELLTQSSEEIRAHCSSLSALVQSQTQQILQLKTMYLRSVRESIALQGYKFDASILINDDEKALFYTGLKFDVLNKIYELLRSSAERPVVSSCSLEDELFYTLVKLQLGLLNKDFVRESKYRKGSCHVSGSD